jgi:F-type H+-transporting ATPase subunit b
VQLLQPALGLIFWTAVIFIIVFFILRKYAWRPILEALDRREKTIDDALKAAEKTKEDMAKMNSEHEALLQQAKQERIAIIGEANKVKEQIIAEAREKAGGEATKIIEQARRDIENRRMEALIDVKNEIGSMVVLISEKVLRRELSSKPEQEAYISRLANDLAQNNPNTN